MEIFLQIILEPLFFVYFDLVENLTRSKPLKKWMERLLKILCIIISTISIFLVIIGAFWVTDVEPFKTYGTVFLVVGASVLLIHILIGLFVGVNHFAEEKIEEEFLDYQRFEKNEPTPQIYYVETNNSEEDNSII